MTIGEHTDILCTTRNGSIGFVPLPLPFFSFSFFFFFFLFLFFPFSLLFFSELKVVSSAFRMTIPYRAVLVVSDSSAPHALAVFSLFFFFPFLPFSPFLFFLGGRRSDSPGVRDHQGWGMLGISAAVDAPLASFSPFLLFLFFLPSFPFSKWFVG